MITYNLKFLLKLTTYYEQLKDENLGAKPKPPSSKQIKKIQEIADQQHYRELLTQEPDYTNFKEIIKQLDRELPDVPEEPKVEPEDHEHT